MSALPFAFVQFDLASGHGLTPGRYPVRPPNRPDGEPEDILVLETVDAPVGRPRRRRGRARPREIAAAEDIPAIPIRRATVVRADPFADEAAARTWLASAKGDAAALRATVRHGLVVLNRALHAHRAAAQDAYVPDVSEETVLTVRIGYGLGEALASGRWTEAVELPSDDPRVQRVESLRPQERVARVLGGHEEVDACEALLLRARADLDAGRVREAALELSSGVAALLVELAETGGPDQAADLADLEARRDELVAAAKTALRAPPDTGELEETLDVAERVIRRRRILG